jgi:hypothetical protein
MNGTRQQKENEAIKTSKTSSRVHARVQVIRDRWVRHHDRYGELPKDLDVYYHSGEDRSRSFIVAALLNLKL